MTATAFDPTASYLYLAGGRAGHVFTLTFEQGTEHRPDPVR
jgi:hypothetical protein